MAPHFRLRKLTAYPEWHRKPFLLNCAEMTDPYTVLAGFFDRYDLTGIRVVLKQWLEDATGGEEAEAASHQYAHENINKLVEAAWVILEQKRQARADEGFDGEVKTEEGGDKKDQLAEKESDDKETPERERFVKWVTFPASLKATPLLYLQRVFEVMELDGLEEVVQRWQRLSLAADYGRYETVGERADLLDFCESFLRLLEAGHVLQRSAEWDAEGRTRWPLSETIKHDLLTEERSYRIGEEEMANPLAVIRGFFTVFSPAYARRELWDMLACAVEHKGEDVKRLDLLLNYECLHAALEAAWLLHTQSVEKNEAAEETQPEKA